MKSEVTDLLFGKYRATYIGTTKKNPLFLVSTYSTYSSEYFISIFLC